MLMIDCCSGLGGASQAMVDRGWEVVTMDNDPRFETDVVADIREWSWNGPRPDLMWFSPPCNEFSREFFVWTRTGIKPDLSIYEACVRIICETQPRYWIIENVRGAVRYFGRPATVYYPYYLWGFFPPLGVIRLNRRNKESYNSKRKAERAMIPYAISLAVARAIEAQKVLI